MAIGRWSAAPDELRGAPAVVIDKPPARLDYGRESVRKPEGAAHRPAADGREVKDIVNYQTVSIVKIILAVLLLVLLVVGRRLTRSAKPDPAGHNRRLPRARRVMFAVLAVLAMANFYHFGFFHSQYLNFGWLDKRAFLHLWEFYHYYTGAKYFDELGYYNLYNATIAADAEDGGRLAGVTRVRDLSTVGFLSRDQILSRSPLYKARFSPQRWQAFTADVRYFTERIPAEAMAKILLDHGYNPPPAWNTTGSFLANRVPVERLTFLALIDVAILLAIVVALGASFGVETALVATAFFGINAFSAFSMTGGAFLRYDWLLALVVSLCLLHRRHYASAGFFLSYAALVRIFPVLFLAGLACKAAYETVRDRALPPRFVRLFVSFLLASILFCGYGCLSRQGLDTWKEFAGRISAHHHSLSANRVGFTMVFLYDETWEDSKSFALAYGSTEEAAEAVVNRVKSAEARNRRATFLLFSLSVLALCALAVIGRPDDEALAWGAVPVFMLLNLANYYYAFLILNAVVWYRDSGRRTVPLTLLTALQVLVLWIEIAVDYPLRATALSSLAFFLFVLALLCVELIGNRKRIGRRLAGR